MVYHVNSGEELGETTYPRLTKNTNYPSHPNFFHVIPTFDPPKDVANNYGQVLQAYFMVCSGARVAGWQGDGRGGRGGIGASPSSSRRNLLPS